MEASIDIARLEERLRAMHSDLKDIKALVTATNGRVRELEAWKARVDGMLVIVGVVATAALGAAAKVLIGGGP